MVTHGFTESRDVVGSLEYARTRPDIRDTAVGLFSRCMGAVSTFAAMTHLPAAFKGVRCLVSPQPVTPRYIAERRLVVMGLGDRLDDFNTLLRLRTSVGLEQRIPQESAKNVRVPTFIYQVRGDTLTDPSDVQIMYDNLPVADRESFAMGSRRHNGPPGRLPRVPAPPTAHARLVRPGRSRELAHGVVMNGQRPTTAHEDSPAGV